MAIALAFATILLVAGSIIPPKVISYAVADEKKVETTYLGLSHEGVVTGYNSLPEQTDDTPFITASGQRTRDGIVANNCLKFGTLVVIGEKTYEVQDRMNKRYGCEHYDIWMEYKSDAVHFGVQHLEVVEIVDTVVQ